MRQSRDQKLLHQSSPKLSPITSDEIAREVGLDGGGRQSREVGGVGDDERPGLFVDGGFPRLGFVK
jgi:hypothetical protein